MVEPAGEDNFTIDATDGRADHHGDTPDYEKRSSYSITIVAESGAGDGLRTSRLNVTVKVTDAEDTGEVKFSQREPQVGRPVVATAEDEDGGVTISAWQWYRNAASGTGVTRYR